MLSRVHSRAKIRSALSRNALNPALRTLRRLGRAARRVLAGILISMVASAAIFYAHAADVSYVYDELGRLVEVVAPDGKSARYAYDAAGNITSITQSTATTVSIAEFTPNGGPVGTAVTIYGSGFITTPASNTVKFNGTTAAVSTATATTLTATVPAGATTGTISVTNTNGTATSAGSFTVGAVTTAAPTLASFTPTSGVAGTAVTVTGTGFQTTTTANQVLFGTYAAPVSSANATTIVTAVPSGEASGKISVTTPFGSVTSGADFYAVPSGHLAADVQVTTRLTVGAGSPTAITTTINGKKVLLIFDGTQGQWVSLALTGSTFAGPINATVYRQDGSVLVSKLSFPRNFVFQEVGYKTRLTGGHDVQDTEAGIHAGVQRTGGEARK